MWYCCRQRAGPLVKECRYRISGYHADDTETERREKTELRNKKRCAVSRKPMDRLELYLALFGRNGWFHTLTFDNEHLPHNFREVRQVLLAFFRRAQRWRGSLDKPPGFDYIYGIEGLHGERRYHVHLITDYYELGPAEVQYLWRQGFTDATPVLQADGEGYHRIARYLNKERTDGVMIPIGRHPFSASRSLSNKLALPERWRDASGEIVIPQGAECVHQRRYDFGDTGAVHYASWLQF